MPEEFRRWSFFLLLLTILIFLPVEIYVVGDWLGAGVHFPLMKWQLSFIDFSTHMGVRSNTMLITLTQEFSYLSRFGLTLRNLLNLLFWAAGSLALALAACTEAAVAMEYRPFGGMRRILGILVMFAGVLFLLSIVSLYGITFSGPAGFSIPLGAAMLLVIGWFLWRRAEEDERE